MTSKNSRSKSQKFFGVPKNKSAQIQVTFNWIYIMVAGGVILLFFVGIVFKQKTASEQALTGEVLRIMESILSGASISEKTKNKVDISGLAQYSLYFNCEEGVGEYGVQGSFRQNAVDPIFAPLEIKATQLNLWSLPYKLPYKVIDFLMAVPENVKYVVVGSNEFIEEFLEETAEDPRTGFKINTEHLENPMELSQIIPGRNFEVRVIDVSGHVQDGLPVPEGIRTMADERVTAVSFVAANMVDYYMKNDDRWEKTNLNPVGIVSMGGERDAAKYGAVFAGNEEVYHCNMEKAFRRLKYLNEIYAGDEIAYGEAGGKLQEMIKYYEERGYLSLTQSCLNYLKIDPDNVLISLETHQNNVAACLLQPGTCVELIISAGKVLEANKNLIGGDCLTLY